ncbi:BON domain-containing protein [Massilia solisilvae]|uniref:BON domain-containing protein n=1 Tax=Massilia solisilvae TaxID=1811225 RepID=A0ABT2BED9_9BURK|nr:BON domain-containing protein [Massilia solisilvae]MCS0606893.1 BON domain-containing protein [Massilia solisilvae]
MKTLIAALLATAAGSSHAFAPTAALNHDPATYRAVTQKAAAEYKAAAAKCNGMSGNDKDVCMAEAKAARARTESDALAKYNQTSESRTKARERVADADYAVARAKCGAMSGADKDSCLNNAKSTHTAALADAKSGRDVSAAGASGSGGTVIAGTGNANASKAMEKCEQAGGDARTGCLVQTKPGPATAAARAGNEVAAHTENAAADTRDAAAVAADKTRSAASTAAEKTKELAQATVEKTKEVAHTVAQKTETALDRAGEKSREVASTAAQKTENTMERAGDKTRQAASTAAHKTENAMERAGEKTRDTAATVADKADGATDTAAANTREAGKKTAVAASDTAITTKVKASLFKEPDLKSLAIHVETEKGVVMLSGFVDSKAEADKAVKVAKEVDGVANVKSAIKVK